MNKKDCLFSKDADAVDYSVFKPVGQCRRKKECPLVWRKWQEKKRVAFAHEKTGNGLRLGFCKLDLQHPQQAPLVAPRHAKNTPPFQEHPTSQKDTLIFTGPSFEKEKPSNIGDHSPAKIRPVLFCEKNKVIFLGNFSQK